MGSPIFFSGYLSVSAGSAKVSGVDSEHPDHPFSNAWQYPFNPWKVWRSAYSSNHEHTLSLTHTGETPSYWAFFGANFTEIEIGGSTFYLGRKMDKSYRAWIMKDGGFGSSTVTIPAQETERGKFELGCVLPINTAGFTNIGGTLGYQIGRKISFSAPTAKLLSGAKRRGNSVRKTLNTDCSRKGVSNANVAETVEAMLDTGRFIPFVFMESYVSPNDSEDNVFLYRIASDFEYTELENDIFSDRFHFEELY